MNQPLPQQHLRPDPASIPRTAADAPPPDYAIDAHHVHVRRDDFALGVENLRIARGSRTAVVGRNGAGKSTLMEALLGLIVADMDGRIFGLDLRRWHEDIAVRRRIGVQLQAVAYPGSVRVSDLVALHDHLYGHRDAAVADALNLGPLVRKPYRALSRGQKQRVDLYMAMAHVPELLMLDEPCTGLDRNFLEDTLRLIGTQPHQTVLMICHTPEELAVATDVLWIRAGTVAAHGDMNALMREHVGEYRLEVRPNAPRMLPALLQRLRASPGVIRSERTSGGSAIAYGDARLQELARELIENRTMDSCAFGASRGADFLRLVTESKDYE